MTVLLILGILVLFFVLLFSLNLKLDIAMEDTLTLRAGLGPVMLTLSPKKERQIDPRDFTYKKHQKRLARERKRALKKAEKKRKRAEAKEAKKAAENEKAAAREALEAAERKKFPLGFIIALVKFVFSELGVFIGYFHTEIKALHITVGGRDAAEIGKTYGYIAQATAYLMELLDHKTKLKPLKADAVTVKADFLLPKTEYRIHIRLRLRLFSIVKVGCHALGWFVGRKIAEAKWSAASAESAKKR